MKTKITVKRRKTVVATKPTVDGAEGEEFAEGEAEGAVAAPMAAAPMPAMPPVKTQSYTWAAIVALIAVVIFIALVALQAFEIAHYDNPPPVFPKFRPPS
jgi:hypothetical protein